MLRETAAQTGGGAGATEALFNMVSICERSQTYTAHSPRGWQETADGSSPLSRLWVKAVVSKLENGSLNGSFAALLFID